MPDPARPGPSATQLLQPRPLTAAAFAPFGTVVAVPADSAGRPINDGNARRFDLVDDLALGAAGGRGMLAIFRAEARRWPLPITQMERHALGSQTFLPLGPLRFAVVVARAGARPAAAADLAAFVTDGRQGVCLAPGTWHHALLAVEGGDFVVIERAATATDCDLCAFEAPVWLAGPARGAPSGWG